nr:MAG TPA: hypothetical protein [Bacteriophage sp.]
MEKDFIDEFISSKDTRAYLHSIHHEFTDLEKVTIVANHIMISYEKKVKWLEQFMDEIIDNSLRNVLEKLTEQLETDGRQIFCVIDELPLLSTHKKRKSRIEENCVVLKELNEFSQKYGVEFVCNVVVSKWSQDYKTAINELREYAPMEYFTGQLNFIG